MPNNTDRAIIEEFERMTPQGDWPNVENNMPITIAEGEEWLDSHTDEHLYKDYTYGEPMYDLSHDKIKSFLQSALKRVREEERERIVGVLERMRKPHLYQMKHPDTGGLIGLTEDPEEFRNTLCDGGSCEEVYNTALRDAITKIKHNERESRS